MIPGFRQLQATMHTPRQLGKRSIKSVPAGSFQLVCPPQERLCCQDWRKIMGQIKLLQESKQISEFSKLLWNVSYPTEQKLSQVMWIRELGGKNAKTLVFRKDWTLLINFYQSDLLWSEWSFCNVTFSRCTRTRVPEISFGFLRAVLPTHFRIARHGRLMG